MSTKTTNYEFVKPALTDAADITSTNGNWDKVDEMLSKRVSTEGGEVTGQLKLSGIVLTEGVDYGTAFPSNPPTGKLFFKRVGV